MLALLAASGSRLLQALVLSKAMETLKGTDQLHAAESLCVVLETRNTDAGAAQSSASQMALDDEDTELSAQVLEKLFPAEMVTSAESWHKLHLSLWKVLLAVLKPAKVDLDFAGQVCHFLRRSESLHLKRALSIPKELCSA